MNHTVKLRSFCCFNRLKSAVNAKVFREGVQGGNAEKRDFWGGVTKNYFF